MEPTQTAQRISHQRIVANMFSSPKWADRMAEWPYNNLNARTRNFTALNGPLSLYKCRREGGARVCNVYKPPGRPTARRTLLANTKNLFIIIRHSILDVIVVVASFIVIRTGNV